MTSEASASARIAPLALDELGEDERRMMDGALGLMGFLPNDGLTMARVPGLLPALSQLVGVLYGPGETDLGLRRLVAIMASESAGCLYCRAHTRHGALRDGLDPDKLAELWNYEISERFSEAERAALAVARGAAQAPNQVTTEQMRDLKRHFDERQVLELVGMIALFGFLNRWNDTLKTTLEAEPAASLETP